MNKKLKLKGVGINIMLIEKYIVSSEFITLENPDDVGYFKNGINYWAKDENKMLPGYIEKTFEHFEVLKKIKYNPKEEKNKKGCKLL